MGTVKVPNFKNSVDPSANRKDFIIERIYLKFDNHLCYNKSNREIAEERPFNAKKEKSWIRSSASKI
ncbi:hypothetical protein A2303_04065 [Candidatus Falkowbacteria bacterium RIFOXYB2_FULL_47_14]|uniref:Uncharacterized protein n=1 Tax=Candidatus Falkowbacteria bacterium RIFOXYA2_FULL_47_19 TaxID=1797994 RepID=A0A1F5SI71_9BACT|nr:MAG: hypothetical protein A2227_03610 [Candidatus Falkowbacteria bacterium RIFOXYA2_FULL_47_19]OGF35440.1 MAG: hypothetical protein A2468_03155 [Candidatus Falkowbacteria bacterium RIFOXYC2_FULL_46_15]OGF42568.1 MAG: hypothetical protein A2303_04065 [Candidatus Falkowbacteria bacterium RIFOXYB2_FULL_47_14]